MNAFIPVSHTALSTFQNCPRMFEGKYVTKEVPYERTPEQQRGIDLHNALEKRIRDQTKMPEAFSHLEWVGRKLDAWRGRGELQVEHKMAMDRHFRPCAYSAQNRYVYGKDDCTLIVGERAIGFEWKSGKLRRDVQQLEIQALLTFANYPRVQSIDSALMFLNASEWMPFHAKRSTFEPVHLYTEFERFEAAQASGEFDPTPCGLCRAHCGVLSCPHNGRSHQQVT